MSEYMGATLGDDSIGTNAPGSVGHLTGTIAAGSIVVFFLICGFLLAYLWTRLYFGRMLEEVTEDDKKENTK
ncbi:MAG: hypothetical protein ACLQQ4_17380 [Bacteroidia bacterium]